MAVYEYATIFSNVLRELYGQEAKSADLFNSNSDIQIRNGKEIKIPTLTVSGYKDHTRAGGYNSGTAANGYETKSLDHDRDIEFIIDPMDVDESNLIVSIANIQKRFETTQAIPELDCYTFSKLYSELKTANSAAIKTDALTTANVLADFDSNLEAMSEAGVPLDRIILYCTPAYRKLIKNAEGIQRTLNVNAANNLDRRIRSIDDISKIIEVPSARLKTKYEFTDGCKAAEDAKQIDYILIDPEAQVSRVKHSYINVFTPGHDSRTADNYLYQNRRYNGTFGITHLLKEGAIIHAEAEE